MSEISLLIIAGCYIASLLILRFTPNDKIEQMGKFYGKRGIKIPFKDIIKMFTDKTNT